MNSNKLSLDEIAVHEAGHVIACLLLNIEFDYVTIGEVRPGHNAHVSLTFTGSVGRLRKDGSMGLRMKRWWHKYVIISLAGGIAQVRYNSFDSIEENRKKYLINWSMDLQEIRAMGKELGISADTESLTLVENCIWALSHCFNDIQTWAATQKIANELLANLSLNYVTCKAIFETFNCFKADELLKFSDSFFAKQSF